MDEWKAKGEAIAKLTLKVYPWKGTHEMNNQEKEEQAELICDTLNQLRKNCKIKPRSSKNIAESGGTKGEAWEKWEEELEEEEKTDIPYYDIKFDVICANPRYDFDLVQQYIVVFENVFGLSLPTCSILDIKNHSFHDISKLFSYALIPGRNRKSSLDKYMALTMRKTVETHVNNEEVKIEEKAVIKLYTEEQKPSPTMKPNVQLEDFSRYLTQKSEIIDQRFVGLMQPYIPGYLRKTRLKLLYSTGKHGISLQTYIPLLYHHYLFSPKKSLQAL